MKDGNKKYIPVFRESYAPFLAGLWDEQKLGRFMAAVIRFVENGTEPDTSTFSDDPYLRLYVQDAIRKMKSSFERYDRICAKRAEAGRKGGTQKAAKKRAAAKEPERPEEPEERVELTDDFLKDAIASASKC